MKDKNFDYHILDSRNLDKVLNEKIVDVIITSPPYWDLKDYDSENQVGFGQSYDKYLGELVDILDNAGNYLKEEGSMWIIVDSFKKAGDIRMLPFEIAQKLKEKNSKWHLQDIIIWHKDKTLPWSAKGKLRNIFEYVLFFTKSPNKFKFKIDELREVELKKWWPKYPERYNPKGKVPSRVWEIPIPVQGWGTKWVKHFCPFPPKLVQNILSLTTDEDDVVMDIFAGSGSVLAQAEVMGRKSIGFDLNENYKNMYKERVLPFYRENWETNAKPELEKLQKKREYLNRTIPLLRKTKYPFSLFKEIKKSDLDMALDIKLILGYLNGETIEYDFIVNDETSDEKINYLYDKIIELSKSKTMSKFSLKPTFKISKFKNIDSNDILCLYEEGSNNICRDKVNLKDFLKDVNLKNYKKTPPLLTNIEVNQENSSINF